MRIVRARRNWSRVEMKLMRERPDGMSGGSGGSTRSSLNHFTADHGPPAAAGHHDDEERGTMKKGAEAKRVVSRE